MESQSMFVKRPTADETEDDILAMQAEWEAKKARADKASVQIHKMKKGPVAPKSMPKKLVARSTNPRAFEEGGRFVIDLEKITEEWSNRVLFDVEERNSDWLESDHSDELARQQFEKLPYSADDGFPEVLDLGAYYRKDAMEKRMAGKKSFFAAEFDRLHGKIDQLISGPDEPMPSEDDNYELENDKYLASLDEEKINELKMEIAEKIDKNTIAFLKDRYKKVPKTEGSKAKVSRFKASRATSDSQKPTKPEETKSSEPQPAPPPPPVVQDMLDQLEVLDEFANRSDQEKYNRLATDAFQLDFTTKCLRKVAPRQQKNAVKLFDSCKIATTSKSDPLLELARSRIDDIKELYLEEVRSGEQTFFQFAHGVNPLVDGSWTLVPVRRVLDAVHKREGEVCPDDVDIIRLSLLWTLLLHDERLTAFLAFAEPNDVYVRLAEVLLIGPEVLADDVIASCYSRILNGYVQKVAVEGRLCLRMDSRVAGLDAFMPFYEDLVVHYEQYSLGDVNFAKTLLIGSYLNSAVGDSVDYRAALWSPKRDTVRQMTIKMKEAEEIMSHIRRLSKEQTSVIEEQYYTQYTTLLGSYTAAIRDEKVTRDRNPLMFTIAAEELGNFIQRHSVQEAGMENSRVKEFDALVEIIRGSLHGKLSV
uniref:RPAP1_N domain-containing protein n=1 Tax=Haemonchus contortus TaxID=6289 RepID=A0A7I5EBU6_HAECO|nr:RNA polymerase II-associated protein 1 domain containing protein [Haemonchus contortus]